MCSAGRLVILQQFVEQQQQEPTAPRRAPLTRRSQSAANIATPKRNALYSEKRGLRAFSSFLLDKISSGKFLAFVNASFTLITMRGDIGSVIS